MRARTCVYNIYMYDLIDIYLIFVDSSRYNWQRFQSLKVHAILESLLILGASAIQFILAKIWRSC